MCYRTQINAKIKEIEKAFDAKFLEPEIFSPQEEVNAFDFSKTPVITDESHGEILMFNWGLIPSWAKDNTIRKMTLNAKAETVTEKPSFRSNVNNRCLIIATGYYEWQWLDSKGKSKQKYFIRPANQDLFAFAGIYSRWQNLHNNDQVNSYSIITTEANELMSEIHNNKKRMPVVLKKEDREKWLGGVNVSHFSFPYEENLIAEKV